MTRAQIDPMLTGSPASPADRRLQACRVVGAGVVAWIGQLAVDMPGGYFGATDRITDFGLAGGLGQFGACVIAAAALLIRARWAGHLFAAVVVFNVALFIPALPDDPLVGAVVIAWQLVILGRQMYPTAPAIPDRALTLEDPRLGKWMAGWRTTVEHALILSISCTVAVVGYRLTGLEIGLLSCLAVHAVTVVMATPWLVHGARRSIRVRLTLLVALMILIPFARELPLLVGILGCYQGLLLVAILKYGPAYATVLRQFLERPTMLLVASFGGLSLFGGIALTFPAASGQASAVGLLDALFTATSAVCVTGLIVLDTPVAFSSFGHVLILMLFQIGGLGIMVLSTFATILLGGRLGLRGEHALEEMLETKAPGHAYRLTRFIVLSTLAIEAVGALMLAVSFRVHDFAWAEAWWRAVFHSVSAFCNAGFALQSDSLVLFQEDPATLIVFTVLILAGGLGFVVLAWTWQRLTRKTRERTGTQTKVVVAVSIALLALGFVEFIAVEWNRSLSDLSLGSKVANAWFQTVTTRTAGFNSVDFVQIHPATVLTFIALMFIGASPGGTGGGIKTTTFAVLVAAVRTVARGEGKPTLFRRVIPDAVVLRASTITVVALILATACTFVLLLSQDSEFSVLAFEAVSALGTVGLSLGATGELGAGGKIAVIITMFAGRIGPLSLALLLARRRARHFTYPAARIMVG